LAPGAILSRREATPLFSLAGVHNGFVFSSRQAARGAPRGFVWQWLDDAGSRLRVFPFGSSRLWVQRPPRGGRIGFWQRSRDATGQIGLFRKYSDGGKRRFSFVWAGLHNRFVFSSGQAARAARCVFLLGAPSRREAALMQVLFCRIQLCPLGSFGPICSGHSGPAARESPYQT
jgi:hypothetical protein